MASTKILVTGANGQLGTDLTLALASQWGRENVIASDITSPGRHSHIPFEILDVTDMRRLRKIVEKHQITQIYHLAASLSVAAERDPLQSWDLNVGSLRNVLEAAALYKLHRVFWPSSIAVFGSLTPATATPQHTITEPTTLYGIAKLAGEGLCRWYFDNRSVDVRSIRFPGIISSKAMPGGGTTDYAVDIFHCALRGDAFICPIAPDEKLPMLYMPDAIRATLQLMSMSRDSIAEHCSYNIIGFSCTPSSLAKLLADRIPGFKIIYRPGIHQRVAENWPDSIDDRITRRDWSWEPNFGLIEMVNDMLTDLRHSKGECIYQPDKEVKCTTILNGILSIYFFPNVQAKKVS